MGRSKYNKRSHIEKSNMLFESRNSRLMEQNVSWGVATSQNDCARITGIKCDEATDANPNVWTWPCALIDGILPTQNDINKTIHNDGSTQTKFIVQSVVPVELSYLDFGPNATITNTITTQCDGVIPPDPTSGTTTTFGPCYGCDNGQIVTDGGAVGNFTNSNSLGVCGTINGVTYYDNQNDPALSDCTGNSVSATGTTSGSTCDFSWTSSCAQTHMQTGAMNSWLNWLSLRENGFNQVGCQHLQNVVNWTTDQLNGGVVGPNQPNAGAPLTAIAIARKTEKRAWAQCQAAECGCDPLNVPPLTGGPTPPDVDPDLIDPEGPCAEFMGLDPNAQAATCKAFFNLSSPSDDPNLAQWTNNGECCPERPGDSGTGEVGGDRRTNCRETGKPEVGCYACKADPSKPYPDGEFSQEHKCMEITTQRLPLVIQYGLRPYDTMEECMEFSYCGKGRPKDTEKPQTGGPTPGPGKDPVKPMKKDPERPKLNEEINRMKKLWNHK